MKKVLLMAAAVATLFASCSKDATEDVVTINGDAAFVASMTFDQDATRHHINNEGKYEWEAGDMVGVAVAGSDEYVPFITKAGGEQAIFEAVGNDLAYLGEGPYFMAYPYGETLTVSVEKETKATTISGLTVPATQRYRAGSFSTMTAPAYAIVDEFALEGQVVDFNAAAAMMQFFVKGVGSIESLNLHVDGVELSGDFDIVIEAEDAENEDAEVEATAENPAEGSDVLLSFGKTPLQLNPYNAVPVVFVVKSGISLAGKTIELTANFGKQQTETVKVEIPENASSMDNIPANKLVNFTKPKVFGFEGKFVIDNKDAKLGLEGNDVAALDFLAYAYFAQEDTQNNAADWEVVFKNLGANADTLQAYILAEQIDLEAFNAETVYNKIGEYATREADEEIKAIVDVYQHVLTWYIKNDNAIESLYWGEKGIGYYGANEEATVINGLSVKGNGITAAANLDNLKFTNSFVEAPVAEKSGTYVGFVAPAAAAADIDVVLGEGNVLIASAENTIIGGIFGNIYANNTAKVEVEALPTMNIASAGFAPATVGQLYGYAGANKNFVISLADNKVTSLEEMPAVAIANGPGYVVDFQDAPADATYANIATKKDGTSVVINGVSYWNGNATESSVGGDAYFTAEELAYALGNSAAFDAVLTHNIDMQCSEEQILSVVNGVTSKVTTVNSAKVGDVQNQFEIKNIIANATGRVIALFGNVVDVKNVKVSNVTLNAAYAADAISGLAITGEATNVVVDGLQIEIAKDVTVASNSIGGVFSVVEAGDVNNVEVKALAVNFAGEKALDARAGVIAGTLNVAPNSTINLGITKLTGTTKKYVFGNIGAKQPETNNPKTALQWYTTEKNYAYSVTPYGTIVVANADFASNGVINAYLNENAQSKNFGRLAAGIVFSFDNSDPKAFGKDSSVEYKYNFFSNTKINNDADANGKFVWGFNPTAE